MTYCLGFHNRLWFLVPPANRGLRHHSRLPERSLLNHSCLRNCRSLLPTENYCKCLCSLVCPHFLRCPDFSLGCPVVQCKCSLFPQRPFCPGPCVSDCVGPMPGMAFQHYFVFLGKSYLSHLNLYLVSIQQTCVEALPCIVLGIHNTLRQPFFFF